MPTRRATSFLASRAGPVLSDTGGVSVRSQQPKSLVLWDPDLGELDLECGGGYIVKSVELGFPTVREVLFEMAYMNGVWDETGFYGSSAVTIGLGLDGARAPVQLLLDNLRAYVLPDKRPHLRYLPSGYTTPREMILRGQDCQAIFNNPRVMDVVAQWVNPSGRSYEYLPESPNGLRCVDFSFAVPGGRVYNRTYPWSYPPGTTNQVNVVNAGNALSPWTMTIFGQVTNPLIDFIHGGSTFTLDLNRGGSLVIPAGGWVKIDSAARSVVDQNGTSLYAKLANATLPALPVGTTTLLARCTSQVAGMVEFCYRSAWV